MRGWVVTVGLVMLGSGCAPVGESPPEAHDASPVPVGPVLVEGSCAGAPPMGDLDAYRATHGVLIRSSPRIRVRSCAVWPAADLRNVVGTLPAGHSVPLRGPLKHGAFSAGIGYAVPLEDEQGQRCRGYISATVLESIERHDDPRFRRAPPLPDSRPFWTGPCLLEG